MHAGAGEVFLLTSPFIERGYGTLKRYFRRVLAQPTTSFRKFKFKRNSTPFLKTRLPDY